MYDWYCNDGDFAEYLNMDYDTLKGEVIKHLVDIGGIDEDEEEDYNPSWHETKEYIETRDEYVKMLTKNYNDEIELHSRAP